MRISGDDDDNNGDSCHLWRLIVRQALRSYSTSFAYSSSMEMTGQREARTRDALELRRTKAKWPKRELSGYGEVLLCNQHQADSPECQCDKASGSSRLNLPLVGGSHWPYQIRKWKNNESTQPLNLSQWLILKSKVHFPLRINSIYKAEQRHSQKMEPPLHPRLVLKETSDYTR